jgi:phosphatidate phosphatase PAH1
VTSGGFCVMFLITKEVNMENKNLKRLNLKLTETEKNFIIEKAKQARMSPSKYFLYLVESRPIQVIDGVDGIIIALNKVGNVLNQIAKTLIDLLGNLIAT